MAAQHQHYVPQLLLRGFLSRDPKKAEQEQVHVFDMVEGREFAPSVANIMGERRFNDLWIDDETLATIEPAVGRIEDYVAPLVERIRREKRLQRTAEEIGDLALLMAFQFIRTKKMRLLPERLDRQLRAHVERMGLNPAKVSGLFEWDENTLKQHHVKQQIEGLVKFTEIIAEKEFFLMVAPSGRTFYLGDHPVVMHNDDERRGIMRGGLGLSVPYIQIYLPLSSDVMLCAYDRAVLGQLMKVRDEEEAERQSTALKALIDRKISAPQMREMLETVKELDRVTPLIETIRAGEAVHVGADQVRAYNSMQAFQAHRFVVDPDGKFDVAKEMISEREASDNADGDD